MKVQPEITFKGVTTNPFTDKLIARGIAGLEKVCDYIVSTRIVIERVQGRHQTGDPFRVQIDIVIPNRPNIIVERLSKSPKRVSGGQVHLDEPLYVQHESELADSENEDEKQR